MKSSDEAQSKHKWLRAAKIARGKVSDDEVPRSDKHDHHADGGNKRRTALSLDDTVQQIDSFFSLK